MGLSSMGRMGSVRNVALLALAVVASAGALAAGQGVKLNDPLARVLRGDTDIVHCSPDGQRVVFRSAANSEGNGLVSVPTKGGTAVVLVEQYPGTLPFQVSPDSQLVHYVQAGLHVVPIDGRRAPQRIAEDAESFAYVPGSEELLFQRATGIFALPLEGGTPVPVAAAPAATTVSNQFSVSADGGWVVFRAYAQDDDGLYSAAVDGSTGPIRLSDELVRLGSFVRAEITPDNLRVVYRAVRDQVHELYSVPIDGSTAPVKLNGPLASNRTLMEFELSRDGSRVLYRSDQDVRLIFELYSAPVAGGEPAIKLNAPLGPGRNVNSFRAAEGGRVVYLADHLANDRTELFVVGVAGPAAPVRLSHPLPAGSVYGFSMTPDGRRAVYQVWNGAWDLFSVSIQRPGASVNLTELTSGETYFTPFAISPDSARVAYIVRRSGPDTEELFGIPIGGGPRTRLDDGGYLEVGFLFTPDSDRVIYVSTREVEQDLEVEELFSVASGGGPSVQLSRPLGEGIVLDDVTSFQFGALGTRGTFVVELQEDDVEELYGVQLEPRSRPKLLATVPRLEASPRSTSAVLISPDEEWVAYTMREGGDGGGYYWLFGVPMDGSRAPVQLHPHPVTGVRFGPDGRTLFYSQAGGGTGVYRVPVDSSEPRQELTGFELDESLPFELSPDGNTLVVLADALVAGEHELFSLPSDGSSPPVQLNDVTAPSASRAYLFQITADGTRVIYAIGDAILGQAVELFNVPIDGSAAPARIAGPLPAGTFVASFVHAPESDRVVYLTRETGPRHRLWSVPADGSAAPVPLSPVLQVDGNAPAYRVVSGGTQVVFRADLAADDVFELFVAPVDGSAPPRRLNGTLVAGGDVHDAFEIDGMGTRVVYRADEKQDEVFELFSAPLGAPAAPLQLTGPHVAGGDVVGYRTVPGGRHVVFSADHDTDDVFELYIAPVDRIKEARKLSGELVEDGDVQSGFAVDPTGKVVYIADQDENSVQEVYLSTSTLPRARPSGAMPRSPR